jgi:hypothetical protein
MNPKATTTTMNHQYSQRATTNLNNFLYLSGKQCLLGIYLPNYKLMKSNIPILNHKKDISHSKYLNIHYNIILRQLKTGIITFIYETQQTTELDRGKQRQKINFVNYLAASFFQPKIT